MDEDFSILKITSEGLEIFSCIYFADPDFNFLF